NPRWALHVLRPEKPFELPISPVSVLKLSNPDPDGKEAKPPHANQEAKPDERLAKHFRDGVIQNLGLENRWIKASDPEESRKSVWVVALDYVDERWRTEKWNLRRFELTDAEGPSGLRLPLKDLPADALRRAMVIDLSGDHVDLFLPPLLSVQFE